MMLCRYSSIVRRKSLRETDCQDIIAIVIERYESKRWLILDGLARVSWHRPREESTGNGVDHSVTQENERGRQLTT
jgi:hypothetical protein